MATLWTAMIAMQLVGVVLQLWNIRDQLKRIADAQERKD